MDIEEPRAARVISIALNDKNSFAMQTGHTEIMAFIFRNVKPSPQQTLFQPIKEELISMHGLHVDDKYLEYVFTYAAEAGGHGSIHLKDLDLFCAATVDPKIRKFRMEGYKRVVHGISKEWQRIRLAAMTWAYKQDTTEDNWCVLPPDFSHRVDSGSVYNWCDFLSNLDDVLLHVRKMCSWNECSTFIEVVKERTLWMADVHNSVIRHMNVPKIKQKSAHDKQLVDVTEKVAKCIASRIRKLSLSQSPICPLERLPKYEISCANSLWTAVLGFIKNPPSADAELAPKGKEKEKGGSCGKGGVGCE